MMSLKKKDTILLIGAVIIIVGIPTLLLADIFKNGVLEFVAESIVVPVYILVFICLFDVRKNKEKHKRIMLSIKILLLLPALYLITLYSFPRIKDIKPLVTHEYSYTEGIAHIIKFGPRGFIQFTVNGEVFSVSTHMYDDILNQPNHNYTPSNTIHYTYKNDFNVKVWYLPNSKYIIDIQE